MSILAYKGRRYDVLAFRGAAPTGEVLLSQTLFDDDGNNGGEICVGVQKLAQRWCLEFLTEQGSMQFDPARGCDFMREVRLGRLRTELDVETVFRFAQLDITRNLRNEESEDMPADERFASADLLAIAILPGSLQLRVRINSVAGEARAVILPINVVV